MLPIECGCAASRFVSVFQQLVLLEGIVVGNPLSGNPRGRIVAISLIESPPISKQRLARYTPGE
jgi:hypothetical protein